VVRNGHQVLRDVDLAVTDGQFVAVLGGNGTGKSTLLRVILGLQPLSTGTVSLCGTPAGKFRDWQRVAYVPQHLLASSAVPVSVGEVVAAGLIRPRHRIRRPNSDTIADALARMDLADRRRDSFHTLSGGQQRRAMIAAAMAKDAELILLDEPTSGVDAANVARLVDVLAQLKADGRTVVLVTHELGALEHLVDRCIVLGSADARSVQYDGPAPAPGHLRDPHGHHDDAEPPSLWGFGT
jgi:zinc transport system ATP-binding protein